MDKGVATLKTTISAKSRSIHLQAHILFEGTDVELEFELTDGLRDLRRVTGRDLDLDLDRRLTSDGRAVPRYGTGEYRF